MAETWKIEYAPKEWIQTCVTTPYRGERFTLRIKTFQHFCADCGAEEYLPIKEDLVYCEPCRYARFINAVGAGEERE
jgi:hypothetical protein